MAFATRRDHEIWMDENAAREALEAADPEAPAPVARRKRGASADPEAPAPVAAE